MKAMKIILAVIVAFVLLAYLGSKIPGEVVDKHNTKVDEVNQKVGGQAKENPDQGRIIRADQFIGTDTHTVKEVMGESEDTETWKNTMNPANPEITTYYYQNGKLEYNFYQGKLVRITVNLTESSFQSKEEMLLYLGFDEKPATPNEGDMQNPFIKYENPYSGITEILALKNTNDYFDMIKITYMKDVL